MRHFVLIFFLGSGTLAFGQNCQCESDSLMSEIISCDSVRFDNNALLYWNFNCDSSWLTFESPNKKKEIIFSLGDGLQDLTGRLGYVFAKEYGKTFLIQNNVISGCCTPPEYYLYDKENGSLRATLDRLIFYSDEKDNPIAIGISGSSHDTSAFISYNSLVVYILERGTKHIVQLPKGEIQKAMNATKRIYPEYLFDNPIVKEDIIILTYYLKIPKKSSKKGIKTITIDLKKYRSESSD